MRKWFKNSKDTTNFTKVTKTENKNAKSDQTMESQTKQLLYLKKFLRTWAELLLSFISFLKGIHTGNDKL